MGSVRLIRATYYWPASLDVDAKHGVRPEIIVL